MCLPLCFIDKTFSFRMMTSRVRARNVTAADPRNRRQTFQLIRLFLLMTAKQIHFILSLWLAPFPGENKPAAIFLTRSVRQPVSFCLQLKIYVLRLLPNVSNSKTSSFSGFIQVAFEICYFKFFIFAWRMFCFVDCSFNCVSSALKQDCRRA